MQDAIPLASRTYNAPGSQDLSLQWCANGQLLSTVDSNKTYRDPSIQYMNVQLTLTALLLLISTLATGMQLYDQVSA